MPIFTIYTQYSARNPTQSNQIKGRNKKNPNWKTQYFTLCRWHAFIDRKSHILEHKALEQINVFSDMS